MEYPNKKENEGEKERGIVGVFDDKKKALNAHCGDQKETVGVMLHRTLCSSVVKVLAMISNGSMWASGREMLIRALI